MIPYGVAFYGLFLALRFISEFIDGGADDYQSADSEGPGEVRERPVFMSRVTGVCVGR